MREIKFRAWNHEMNKMIDCEGEYHGCLNGVFRLDGITFMQYTGLRDRSGREIYGGDIVKHSIGATYEVRWSSNGAWSLYHNQKEEGLLIEYNIEVIGNVFETPELLEASA